MAWIFIIIAGLLEVGFTTALNYAKHTTGSAAILYYTAFVISLSLSMYFMFLAIRTLPMGTAYAVWTGIGAAGTVIVGILFFKESLDFWRIFFIITLIASIIGLKYVSS